MKRLLLLTVCCFCLLSFGGCFSDHSNSSTTIPVPNSNTKPIAVHTDIIKLLERYDAFTR